MLVFLVLLLLVAPVPRITTDGISSLQPIQGTKRKKNRLGEPG